MAKTITISNTEIVSIVINQSFEADGTKSGLACLVSYRTVDDSGNTAMSTMSTKFTQGSNQDASSILSDASNTLVVDFVNAMQTNMNEREEL